MIPIFSSIIPKYGQAMKIFPSSKAKNLKLGGQPTTPSAKHDMVDHAPWWTTPIPSVPRSCKPKKKKKRMRAHSRIGERECGSAQKILMNKIIIKRK